MSSSRISRGQGARTKSPPLKCSQCLEHYKDPRLLDCYHSFCGDCLQFYVEANEKDGKFNCPLCKSEISLPEEGVKGFPKNYYITSLFERDAVKCDVCGEKTKAEYACIDCVQNYCGFCLKYHSKLQGTKDHRVATVDESGKRTVKKTAALCKIHPKLELNYFCDTCQELVCIDCNMTNHKAHECLSVSEVVTKFKEKLQSAIGGPEHEAILSSLQKMRKELKQKKNQGSDQNDKLVSAIEKQAQDFHKMIDEIKSNMIRTVMETGNASINGVNEATVDVERRMTSFGALIQFSRLLLAQADDVDIVMHGAKLAAKIDDIKEEPLEEDDENNDEALEFDKHDLKQEEVEELFGKLNEPNANTDEEEEDAKEVDIKEGSFECKDQDGVVTSIAPCDDGTAWVCFGNDGIIQLYDMKGKCLQSVEVGQKVDDVVKKEDNIYLSCNARKKILVYKEEAFSTFTRTKSCARGLAIGDSEHVIVSLTEKDVFYNCSDDPAAYLIKVTEDSQQKKVLGQNSMKYPARIATNGNGNIVISDWIALQVIVLDSEGNQISNFEGLNKDEDFIPRGVCCGINGTIYVIDSETDSVLKMNTDCSDVKQFANVDSCWSIACDNKGRLWVGTQDGKVKILKG